MKELKFKSVLQKWGDDEILLVFSNDGQVSCRLSFYKDTPQDAVISDLYVHESIRKQGCATAILNWCIEGLKLYYKDGAKPPQAVTTATDEYRTNSDKIGNFIAECLEQQAGTNTKALDVYIKYKEWCSNNGFGVENKGNFFDELRGKNIFAPSGTINGVTVRNVIKDYVLIRDEIEERPPYYSYSSRKSDRNYYD